MPRGTAFFHTTGEKSGLEVFTSNNPTYRVALRDAVTTQSTRKNLTALLRIRLATALIVRGIGGCARMDRIRRYMQHGFGEAVRDGDWSATFRSPDDLLQAGLKEYEADPDKFGPDRLELAARGAYPLIASLALHADRGTADSNQPDRRTPGQVIDAMLRQPTGLRQLHRALIDHPAPIRVVNESGNIVRTDDGAQERYVTDAYLRTEFPAPGSIKAPRSDRTAGEKLQAALARVSAVVNDLEKAQKAVEEVLGADGSPLVETQGVAKSHCDAWAVILKQMSDAIVEWRATWRRRHRNAGSGADTHVEEEWDDKSEAPDTIVAEWDDEAEGNARDEEQTS